MEDVVAVLDALEIGRALVVGHSWGGHLAMHLAVAFPERLELNRTRVLWRLLSGRQVRFDADLSLAAWRPGAPLLRVFSFLPVELFVLCGWDVPEFFV